MPSSTSLPLTTSTSTARAAHRRPLWRLPGVYRPQDDTWLLVAALTDSVLPPDADVLDFCTGSGAVAVAAAERGARRVVAVDVSRSALASVRLNAWTRRLPLVARRGVLAAARDHGPYDVVLANPPYVPAAGAGGRASAHWDGGTDGRSVLGPLCRTMTALLRPGGFVLLVQSAVANPARTLAELRGQGLDAVVAARTYVPFGPVMRRQASFLTRRGLIDPGQRTEELVVIRGDRPSS